MIYGTPFRSDYGPKIIEDNAWDAFDINGTHRILVPGDTLILSPFFANNFHKNTYYRNKTMIDVLIGKVSGIGGAYNPWSKDYLYDCPIEGRTRIYFSSTRLDKMSIITLSEIHRL